MAFEIRPIKGDFVGEVLGVVSRSTTRRSGLEAAWYRHSILVFRNLAMSPEQHIEFTGRLGKPHIMEPLEYKLEGHPEIFVVSNAMTQGRSLGLRGAGMGFHTDGEDKAIPNAGSFLYALKSPPEGGDTLFSDLYATYDAIPSEVKRGETREIQPYLTAPSPLSTSTAAHRGAEARSPRRTPPARPQAPALGPHCSLYRAVGVRHRGDPARGR